MRAVILAAGKGTRLGYDRPKCLVNLPNGSTILENQVKILRQSGISEIVVVVGYKKEVIMDEHPDLLFVYNSSFQNNNTAKSLHTALMKFDPKDTLWMNGDVYFENEIIHRMIFANKNAIAVNTCKCGDEEVKYTLNTKGCIESLSKEVPNGLGEAVGINSIKKECYNKFIMCLEKCKEKDYFEKGIEYLINENVDFHAIDMSGLTVKEIDFHEDLLELNKILKDEQNESKYYRNSAVQ